MVGLADGVEARLVHGLGFSWGNDIHVPSLTGGVFFQEPELRKMEGRRAEGKQAKRLKVKDYSSEFS